MRMQAACASEHALQQLQKRCQLAVESSTMRYTASARKASAQAAADDARDRVKKAAAIIESVAFDEKLQQLRVCTSSSSLQAA
jgi:prophage DNA circulation protein